MSTSAASYANLNGFGLESAARFATSNSVSVCIELVDKDELLTAGVQRVGAYTAGYLTAGLGTNFTVYSMPAGLRGYYGDHPVAVSLFVRIRFHS